MSNTSNLNREQIKASKWWTITMVCVTIMVGLITRHDLVVCIIAVALTIAIWYVGRIGWRRFFA